MVISGVASPSAVVRCVLISRSQDYLHGKCTFFGNIQKVKIFVTIKQGLFNKGLCRTENFEVVCSLYQVSVSEYINEDVSGYGYSPTSENRFITCVAFDFLQLFFICHVEFLRDSYDPMASGWVQTGKIGCRIFLTAGALKSVSSSSDNQLIFFSPWFCPF